MFSKFHIFLLSIFIITVIPIIYLYIEHGYEEFNAYFESVAKSNEYKAVKQFSEGLLFFGVGIGYLITAIIIIIKPRWKIPYLIIIIGTIALTMLYYMRIYGIPVPGTDITIRDLTTETVDVITKICQQIIVVPTTIMLMRVYNKTII